MRRKCTHAAGTFVYIQIACIRYCILFLSIVDYTNTHAVYGILVRIYSGIHCCHCIYSICLCASCVVLPMLHPKPARRCLCSSEQFGKMLDTPRGQPLSLVSWVVCRHKYLCQQVQVKSAVIVGGFDTVEIFIRTNHLGAYGRPICAPRMEERPVPSCSSILVIDLLPFRFVRIAKGTTKFLHCIRTFGFSS